MLLGEGTAFVPSLQGKYPLRPFQTETFEAQTVVPITWPEKADGLIGCGAIRRRKQFQLCDKRFQFDGLELPSKIAIIPLFQELQGGEHQTTFFCENGIFQS